MTQNDHRKMTLGIVGGGRGGLEMLKLLTGSELVQVVFMVDQDINAVGMQEAKSQKIPTKTDLVKTLKSSYSDFVIEATGSEKVAEIIREHLSPDTEMITSKASLMLFNVMTENSKKTNAVVSEEIKALSDEISQNAQSVSMALTDITNVAFSLKVLAINATIEAARAGESGRSFSVVADAVKETANDAQGMVERIANVNNNNAQMSEKLDQLLEKLQ